MPRLLQTERERASGMLTVRMTQIRIANPFNVSRMTFFMLKTYLRDTGTTNDSLRSGKTCETTLQQDRHIRIILNRFVNASKSPRQTRERHYHRI